MVDFEIRYATTSSGASIGYAVAGSGPTMIMLPGTLGVSVETSFPVAAPIFGSYRVIGYDSLGSGLSDREHFDPTPDGRVEELRSVVRALGSERHSIVGVGSGGPTAVRYAAMYPERVDQLILANTFANGSEFVSWGPMATFMSMVGGDATIVAETYVRVMLGLSGAPARLAVERFEDTVSGETYLAYVEALAREDAAPLLRDISVPTLVLAGGSGAFSGVSVQRGKALAAAIPDARLELVDDLSPVNVGASIAKSLGIVGATGTSSLVQSILFTDLEASTPLTQRLGDEGAQEILRGHNTTVRAALDEHGGHEVKHTGDGIMASFPSAVAAVTAALQIQRELAGGEVLVRVGLNAGEPIAEDDDFFGLSVIKAARVADRAEAGQVLVSRVVMDLCEGKTFQFSSVGDVSLKGFDGTVELFEVRDG